MENTKLVRVLQKLDARAMKDFLQFVSSEYHNKNEKIIQLLEILAKKHLTNLEENEISKIIFGKENKKALIKLASKLFTLLKQYILIEENLNDSFEAELALIKFYGEQQLFDDFERLSNRLLSNLLPIDSAEKALQAFLLHKEINRYESTTKDKGSGDATFNITLKKLDEYYLYQRLIYACQLINRSHVIKDFEVSPSDYNSDALLTILGKSELQNVNTWQKALEFLERPISESAVNDFKKTVFKDTSTMVIQESKLLFSFLENALFRLYFNNKKTLYQDLFELYDFQHNKRIFLVKGYTNSTLIKNYITVAIQTQNLLKARKFLVVIKNDLDHHQLPVYNYCRAMLSFEQKSYEETLEILNSLHFDNIYLKIDERRLRIKTYYELRYESLLIDSIMTFRVFLSENREIISEFHLVAHRHFLNFVLALVELPYKDKTHKNNLADKLQSETSIVEQQWLLKKFL